MEVVKKRPAASALPSEETVTIVVVKKRQGQGRGGMHREHDASQKAYAAALEESTPVVAEPHGFISKFVLAVKLHAVLGMPHSRKLQETAVTCDIVSRNIKQR